MDKVITFNSYGAGASLSGTTLSTSVYARIAIDEPLDFPMIRKALKTSWKQVLTSGSKAIPEYRFYCVITIVTTDTVRFKEFIIDPKNFK